MSAERYGGVRARIAQEAARLMYEECVKQYFTAKRMAAKRVLGKVGGKGVRFRPADLPSNGEIRDALLALAELSEGSGRTRRLFAMRILALETLRALAPFEPRLIGSVSTGHIRRGSDIDIQIFPDDPGALEQHLRALDWVFDREQVTIRKFGEVREYLHLHVADVVPIELTVYEPRDLRFRPRSSTDGKPIVRMGVSRLERLLVVDHPDEWRAFLETGAVAGMEELIAGEDVEEDAVVPAAGAYDGLLEASANEMEVEWPEPGEGEDPDQISDPLPGFEGS